MLSLSLLADQARLHLLLDVLSHAHPTNQETNTLYVTGKPE
jgi:hypothetical protein